MNEWEALEALYMEISSNNGQTLSILTMTNNIEICKQHVFKNYNHFDENILIVTNDYKHLPNNHKTKVHSYKWDNNYSNPLNFGIGKCTGDWILRLDSDEFIHDEYIDEIYKLINDPEFDYYLINIFSFHENPYTVKNPKQRNGFLPRLWRNHKGVKFDYLIHEQNYLSIQENHLRGGIATGFGIYHFGEIGGEENFNFGGKHKYYHELIKKQIELTPHEPRYYEFVGNYYYHKQQYKEALGYIQKACEYCHPEKLPYYINKRIELLNKIKQNNINKNVMKLDNKLETLKPNQEGISVILPVYNELQLTDDLLNNINSNNVKPDEIILIDNGSIDNIYSLIQKYPELNINYVRNKENLGVNPAWNQGIQLAKYELITILNNDIIINRFFFEKIKEAMNDNKVGIVIPETVLDKERVKLASIGQQVKVTNITTGLQGWAFTIRREIIEKAGLIPEKYKFWFGDNYLFNQTSKAGYLVQKMNNNYIYHYGSITLQKVAKSREIQEERRLYAEQKA